MQILVSVFTKIELVKIGVVGKNHGFSYKNTKKYLASSEGGFMVAPSKGCRPTSKEKNKNLHLALFQTTEIDGKLY